MKTKPLNKQNSLDKQRRMARYENKLIEFNLLTLDQLKELYNTKKLSSTDKYALLDTVDKKLKEKVVEEAQIKGQELIDNE